MIEKSKGIKCRFEALGTYNSIEISGRKNYAAINRAMERVLEIDDRMSAFKAGSDISSLNRSTGGGAVNVFPETFRLLQLAKKFSSVSGGAFDITVRPLVELWGIGKKGSYIPPEQEILRAARLVDYSDLVLDEKRYSASLKRPGQSVDLGGIAKGYAADEVKRILEEDGIKNALIDLGGNIVAMGTAPDGAPWKIGIQNPMNATGRFMAVLPVAGRTFVTSGSNESFFVRDGIRYHHILDPLTGKPAHNGLMSVTVIGGNSAQADALTTALFVLGVQRGIWLLKKFSVEAVFVTEEGKVFATEGLKSSLALCKPYH